jgi:hypothetical protein
MKHAKRYGWAIIALDNDVEHFYLQPVRHDGQNPFTHITFSENKATAKAALTLLRQQSKSYAEARIVPVIMEMREISEDEMERTGHIDSLRQWWTVNGPYQRAGALEMGVGPTIKTAKGVKDIRAVAAAAFDDLDATTLEFLISKSMNDPYFLD